MKRLIALIMVLILSVGLLAACSNDDVTSSNSSVGGGTTVTDALFSTERITFIDSDNESVYRIVRPEGDSELTTTAGALFKKMKETLGVNIKNISDTTDGTDAYEILIGHTNRPESQKALEYLNQKASGRYNDYIICTIGKKIVLNAESIAGIKAACEYFAANYLKADGIDGGIAFVFEAEGNFKTSPFQEKISAAIPSSALFTILPTSLSLRWKSR